MKIGIGISCYNRSNIVRESCRTLLNFKKKYKIIVSDDGSSENQQTYGIPIIHGKNMGVAINKNRLLYHLRDCDYIFLLEDDVRIKNMEFIEKFIELNKKNGCSFLSYGPIETWNFWKILKKEKGFIEYKTSKNTNPKLFYTPGSFTALTKQSLEKVGGLNSRFKGLGMEHMEWSMRFERQKMSMDSKHIYKTLDLKNSLEFYNVKRNKRDINQCKKNEKLYYELIESPHIKNTDYLSRKDLYFKPRVYGIGMSKTGTNSLTEALRILNIPCEHFPIDQRFLESLNKQNTNAFDFHQSITDITTIPFIEKLSNHYPESKFILTTREEKSWIRSIKHHWEKGHELSPIGKNFEKMHPLTKRLLKDVYGRTSFDEEHFLKKYRLHTKTVNDLFQAKIHSKRLINMNIVEGDGWVKLCKFLEIKTLPIKNFPFKGSSKKSYFKKFM
ncbi:MAG: glycosyltransferase [Candidatus Nitrosopelagicus sp.]|jgi:hypothetical protein|nr:glycosyltransferase [Candidatus Nitrosopelagicus sp.]